MFSYPVAFDCLHSDRNPGPRSSLCFTRRDYARIAKTWGFEVNLIFILDLVLNLICHSNKKLTNRKVVSLSPYGNNSYESKHYYPISDDEQTLTSYNSNEAVWSVNIPLPTRFPHVEKLHRVIENLTGFQRIQYASQELNR